MSARRMVCVALLMMGVRAFSQTVSPVIVEYKVKAEGRFDLTNNTLTPLAVVLEPKSFSITPDGNGVYRPLDPNLHLKLSSMSFRIDPGQTYYVFYSAKADQLPAWFTVYAVFSSVQHTAGLDVRILLPHTVYIYPKKPFSRDEVKIKQATYIAQSKKIVCDIENDGPDLDRVQELQVSSGQGSMTVAGFPLLPDGKRHLEVDWDKKDAPESIQLRLEHSVLKAPISAGSQ